MTTLTTQPAGSTAPTARHRGVRLLSLFGGLAGGGAGLALLFSNPTPGETGAEVSGAIADSAGLLQLLAIIAVLGSAALLVAAAVLGSHLGGTAGRVATMSGAAVALLQAAYLATFGAAAAVSTLILDDAGPALAEAMLLGINLVDLTRYAPSLALVAAAVAGRAMLPKPVWITAAVLAVLVVLPFTSWIAAILAPLWLGVSAAALGSERDQ